MAETKKRAPRKRGAYRPLKAPETDGKDPPAAGHNNPPEETDPDPFDTLNTAIEDLFLEAQNWLDGEPISNEKQAEAVTTLKGLIADVKKSAETEQKAESRPHYEAHKAAIARWKPMIEKADKAVRVANRALTPWLEMLQAEQKRKADEARAAAEAAAEALRKERDEAFKSSSIFDDDAVEERERELKEAEKAARRAMKETASINTGAGRASLRTHWLVSVTDARDLLMHYMRTDPDWLKSLIRERAEKEVRAGTRNLPGCRIWSEQRAV